MLFVYKFNCINNMIAIFCQLNGRRVWEAAPYMVTFCQLDGRRVWEAAPCVAVFCQSDGRRVWEAAPYDLS